MSLKGKPRIRHLQSFSCVLSGLLRNCFRPCELHLSCHCTLHIRRLNSCHAEQRKAHDDLRCILCRALHAEPDKQHSLRD